MGLRSYILELAENATDDVVEWAQRQFGDLADTPAARRTVRRAVEERAARPTARDLTVRRRNRAPDATQPLAATSRGARVTERPAERGLPRRMEQRSRELPRVMSMTVERELPTHEAPPLSVFNLEGRPFITSMSDLSAGGDRLLSVNDVPLREPFERRGGQDYMFNNEGSVWAADRSNARQHVDLAERLRAETGQDPLYMPWAMGPRAVDFAHMPRELMLRYADATLNTRGRNALARDVREFVPEFRSTDDPLSVEAFMSANGRARAGLNRLLDQRRDETGLGMGAARLASTDLDQIDVPLTSLRNVGVIEPSVGLEPSTHPTYNTSIAGYGLGRLEEPIGALDLLPEMMQGRSGPFDFPVGVVRGESSPLRSLQMAPKGGVITEDILRAIEARLAAEREADFAVRR